MDEYKWQQLSSYLIHSIVLSWEATVMEIKRILLNTAINKLHARAAVMVAPQADVPEYLST